MKAYTWEKCQMGRLPFQNSRTSLLWKLVCYSVTIALRNCLRSRILKCSSWEFVTGNTLQISLPLSSTWLGNVEATLQGQVSNDCAPTVFSNLLPVCVSIIIHHIICLVTSIDQYKIGCFIDNYQCCCPYYCRCQAFR